MAKKKWWLKIPGYLYLLSVLIIPIAYNSCGEALDSGAVSNLSCDYYQATYAPGGEALSKASTKPKKRTRQKLYLSKESVDTPLAVTISNSCAKSSEQISGKIYKHQSSELQSMLDKQTYEYQAKSKDEILQLESDSCVLTVSELRSYTSSVSFSDPLKRIQTSYLTPINYSSTSTTFFNDTYGIQTRSLSRPIMVAVLDSGVDHTHPDLNGQMLIFTKNGSTYYGYDVSTELLGETSDFDGHGTHIAGLIAAKANETGMHGISPVSTAIMNIRTFYPSSQGPKTNSAMLQTAIQLAIANRADIINLSLQEDRPATGSGSFSDDFGLKQAIENAVDAGIFVVMSLGNADNFSQDSLVTGQATVLPGKYGHQIEGAMTVIASSGDDKALAPFSYYHPQWGEIAAPGANIYSASVKSISGKDYEYRNGTSQAAPIVSGAAALIIGFLRGHGYLPTPKLVEEMLKSSSENLPHMLGYVQNGNHLDLQKLTELIEKRFPSTMGKTCIK